MKNKILDEKLDRKVNIKNKKNDKNHSTHYATKKLELIMDYFKSHKEKHITAEDIINYFKENNVDISKATIYRKLDLLVKEGVLSKYVLDENTSACYTYIKDMNACKSHYHLKCSSCDKLFHVNDNELTSLSSKLKDELSFEVDISKTVLYGMCKECIKKRQKAKN